MNEIETKVAEAIKTIERLLLPMATSYESNSHIVDTLTELKEALITAVGRRVIKEGLNG